MHRKQVSGIPAPYSKVRKAEQFRQKLLEYPKQLCNTTEAFQGKVFELYVHGMASSLSELSEYYDHNVLIFIKADDETLAIERDSEGNFKEIIKS